MSYLGIDTDLSLVVEGSLTLGRLVIPPPYVCQATVIGDPADLLTVPDHDDLSQAPYVFREDSFDAPTRIRRGRLYRRQGGQPSHWNAVLGLVSPPQGYSYMTFQTQHWHNVAGGVPHHRIKLALGTQEAYSLWDVLLVEKAAPRDFLLTLRSHSNFIALTNVAELAISDAHRADLQRWIDKAIDAALRLDPDATVDHCRHAATIAIGAWLSPILGSATLESDLGALKSKLEKVRPDLSIVRSACEVIARLHSRTKPSEREKHGLRINVEADGDFALSMLGLVLRELCKPAESA